MASMTLACRSGSIGTIQKLKPSVSESNETTSTTDPYILVVFSWNDQWCFNHALISKHHLNVRPRISIYYSYDLLILHGMHLENKGVVYH